MLAEISTGCLLYLQTHQATYFYIIIIFPSVHFVFCSFSQLQLHPWLLLGCCKCPFSSRVSCGLPSVNTELQFILICIVFWCSFADSCTHWWHKDNHCSNCCICEYLHEDSHEDSILADYELLKSPRENEPYVNELVCIVLS